MKYLCLIYIEEKKIDAIPKSEYDALLAEAIAYTDELRQSGHLIASEALQRVEAATTVRHRNGNISMTDGPFAETKEQLGGFLLIEARDLNEALRLTAKFPPGRFGSIEVRPTRELPRP